LVWGSFFDFWVIYTSKRSPAFSCILHNPFAKLENFFGKVHTILTSKFSAVTSDCPSGPMMYMSERLKWVSVVILAGDWIQLIFLLDFKWVFYQYIIFSSINSTTNTTSIIIVIATTILLLLLLFITFMQATYNLYIKQCFCGIQQYSCSVVMIFVTRHCISHIQWYVLLH